MAKSLLLSVKPQWVEKILNNIKTIEIRKRFPKDYVGWVYIYCTKNKKYANLINRGGFLTGMVCARFWCDNVEEYVNGTKWSWKSGAPMWGACNDYEYILKDACLTEDELYDYCEDLSFKAIHITKLEIFDKPKEISEFYKCQIGHKNCIPHNCNECPALVKLTKPFQSWGYIWIE